MVVARTRTILRAHRSALGYFVATSAVNVTNFAFHVVVSRALGTEAYGGLSALLVLVVVLTVPVGALQLACTHAQAGREHDAPVRRLTRRTAVAGAGAGALLAALSPVVQHFLHLGSPVPVVLLGAWLFFAVVGGVPAGILLAQQRYTALAVATFVGGGVTRLVAGYALAPSMKTSGGVLATVISAGVMTGLMLWSVRNQLRPSEAEELHVSSAQGVLSLAAMIGLALITGVDTLLAQHVMHAREASLYSAAAVAGRMALFAPAAVALIAFPRFVTAAREGRNDTRTLWGSLAVSVALGAIAAAVLSLVPTLVVRTLFGAQFAPAGKEVPLLALEGVALAVLTLLTYFHLARGGRTSLLAGIGAVGLGVFVWWRQPGLHELALTMVVVVAALAGLALVRAILLQTRGAVARAALEEAPLAEALGV